jgi:hypothetical protein
MVLGLVIAVQRRTIVLFNQPETAPVKLVLRLAADIEVIKYTELHPASPWVASQNGS